MHVQWAYSRESLSRIRELVLKKVSCLDAFSSSPLLTWLSDHTTEVIIGTLEVRQ